MMNPRNLQSMFWKKKKQNPHDTRCFKCGQIHTEWPALSFDSPTNYFQLSDQEKSELTKLSTDFCEIRYEDQTDRFIRVTLFQKVNDHCYSLDYGLWVSLSEKSYSDYKTNFNNDNHETLYFGWLCNNLPHYPETLAIPCDVFTKSGKSRPEIVPHQNFDHPFVKDYHAGITTKEAEFRISEMT